MIWFLKPNHSKATEFAPTMDEADGGVDPLRIVVAFDIGEQVTPRGISIGVFALVDEFGFQRAEEAQPLARCPSSFPCGSSIVTAL